MNRRIAGFFAAAMISLPSFAAAATITSLSDNFNSSTIDSSKWSVVPSNFEAGTGTYTVDTTTNLNQLTIAGTTSSPYWGGDLLKSVDTFSSALQTTITVDRVSLTAGVSGSRSGLWISQGTGGQYLLFADNTESGPGSRWTYNNTNTGTGTAIGGFGGTQDDLGLHSMKLVYTPGGGNSASVAIYLDGTLGTTVNFNNWNNGVDFSVSLMGSARDANESATAVFDNFSAQAVPEPASLVLFGLASIGLFVTARRRK